jgi:hypothetical protein
MGVEVQLYSFLTSELEWVGGQHHAPAALLPGKTRYAFYRRLGGPQGRSGPVRKISPPPGFFFIIICKSSTNVTNVTEATV